MVIFPDKVDAKAKQPKTLRWEYDGIVEYSSLWGDLFKRRGVSILFIMWVVVSMQSPQNSKGRCDWNLEALAIFHRCWGFVSTMAFCCGVSTQLSWWMMLWSEK